MRRIDRIYKHWEPYERKNKWYWFCYILSGPYCILDNLINKLFMIYNLKNHYYYIKNELTKNYFPQNVWLMIYLPNTSCSSRELVNFYKNLQTIICWQIRNSLKPCASVMVACDFDARSTHDAYYITCNIFCYYGHFYV